MDQYEISTPCNLSDDVLIFWLDDGHVFSKVHEIKDGVVWSETDGCRHDLQDAIALRDWLTAAITELENSNE